jgi:hypothetical protein
MLEQRDSFEIDGVWIAPSGDDPATFEYIPGAPAPECDQQGRPTLLLFASDQGARLQLGTRWGLDAEEAARLEQAITERFPGLQLAQPALRPAPVSVGLVELVLGDGLGAYEILKASTSSGFPPFAAIFAVSLTAAQKECVLSALNGRVGFLAITYRGERTATIAVVATIVGDVHDDIAELGRTPMLAECAAQVDLALEQGQLALEISSADVVPDELLARATTMVRNKAARIMQRMAADAAMLSWPSRLSTTSMLTATVRLEDTVQLPIERTADIGTWFATGGGADHIKVVGVTLPDPLPVPTDGTSVAIGFEPQGAPIAFVEIARGMAKATLRSPGFAAATLPAGIDGPLVITTHYTASGAPYQATLELASATDMTLTPADVGLARVTIDGARPQAEGAREARVRVRYLPDGMGVEDDRTIYLRGAEWAVSWYVITRAADLGGRIELEWKETATDGTASMHPREYFSQSEITL